MTGLEFLGIIRKEPLLKDKKVAIVSVSGSYGVRETAKKLGAVDYIVKSEYKLDDIIDKLASQINGNGE